MRYSGHSCHMMIIQHANSFGLVDSLKPYTFKYELNAQLYIVEFSFETRCIVNHFCR